jgi:citrate lyase subunit beta/citryl-CoA lyase
VSDSSPIRTALFVPGTRLDRVSKALASGADAVIIDLEDAVPLSRKSEIRQEVARFLNEMGDPKIMVRVNGPDTAFFTDDIAQIATATLLTIIVPKVESVEDIAAIHQGLLHVEKEKGLVAGQIAVIGLIETAKAVDDISRIVHARTDPQRLRTVAFGAADYTADLGIEITKDGAELFYARSRLPIACRAAGLEPPLDTPFMIDLKDLTALETESLRAKQLGFQGKLCIHPNQIARVNRIFSPKPEEIRQARKVIEAFEKAEAAGQGAIQVEGKFVDYPVVARARRILQLAAVVEEQ